MEENLASMVDATVAATFAMAASHTEVYLTIST